MGGFKINAGTESMNASDKIIGGLYGLGEPAGGIHGSSRLGTNSLSDCVVFGRVSDRFAAKLFTSQGHRDQAERTHSESDSLGRSVQLVFVFCCFSFARLPGLTL
mmetsp:Transcript_166613/g.535064  ORF Transcript_166613/g.535064 Transcript_166613/m.535064 type:complete len:105 (-) Transcript_166613:14-328(-)